MTAGPDERALRVIRGGGPETEEQAEARIREDLRRLGVGPGGPAASPPPMPAQPPRFPAQPPAAQVEEPGGPGEEAPGQTAPVRAANDRLPRWWEARKPHLEDPAEAAAEEPGEAPEPDGEQPAPTPTGKGRGPQPARRPASKTGQPAQEDGKQGAEEPGEEQVPDGPRWSRPYLGRPPGLPPKKKNLITWWREDFQPEHKWLAYHGTGLGGGVYFGVFSFGTRSAEYVTQRGLGDLEADITLGLLGLVLVVDYRVRNLLPPLAWFVRAISTSLVVGAAWNGTPLADLTN